MSMEMKKEFTIVRPAEETPKHNLWLSRLDMVPRHPLRHCLNLFVFHNKNNNILFDTNIMKESLSKVLVPFYPMAGRLKEDTKGRIEIDCNADGALFIEAKTDHSLADFGDFKYTMESRKLIIPSWDYSKGITSFPLLMVQLTRFSCGGVTLGFAQHHYPGDGVGHVHFIKSWGRLARGLDLELMPYHERLPHFSLRNPPQVKFQHTEFDRPSNGVLFECDPKNEATFSVFKLSRDQINGLKDEASVKQKVNTYEVVAGHIWRAVCKSRDLADEQEVRLYIPTDGRYRLKNPPLPKGYVGNVVFSPYCVAKVVDLVRNPVSYVANKIHETMKIMTNEEYLRSSIDYMETHPNYEVLVGGPHRSKCPNLTINSWATFNPNEVDFGWGQPSFVGPGVNIDEGLCILIPNQDEDGGFIVSIHLLTSHMPLFENYLYDFSS